jgi:hypothetical protein
MTENRKNTAEFFSSSFFKKQTALKAAMKDVQATREALSPKKRQTALQRMKFINCFIVF